MALSVADLDAIADTDFRIPLTPDVLRPALASPPFIQTRTIANLRDLGALPGSRLIETRFYRSGSLESATKDAHALAWLASHVRRVFDLRLESERKNALDPNVAGMDKIWHEVEQGYEVPSLDEFALDGGVEAWKKEYMNCAMAYRPTIRAVLEHVRDRPREPILFHCTDGRDRTSVVAGLLHALAGSSFATSTRDYMLSRIGTELGREKLHRYALASRHIDDPKTPGFYNLLSLRPEFWKAFHDGLEERFGGWDGYVTKALGFSEADLALVKENLRS
ncbi:hypothetical protein E4U30_001218 [Claviceps sp. LM220 group G6]|nr:hypothetical protein E4U30_001218 [Claviceps sp. LM220 group G6]KAG6105168.1 hypothetical protein E4U31_001532 [Claviceps sp. LM219 group G6]